MKGLKRILFPGFMVLLWGVRVPCAPAPQQELFRAPAEKPKDRARLLLSRELPRPDSQRLKVSLIEVDYGPGESSPPHSHPCAVVGFVVSGAVRTQIQGEPEVTYQAGGSFYEAPNGVHLVSANASTTEPAKLVAYLICAPEAPLSVDVGESPRAKGVTP